MGCFGRKNVTTIQTRVFRFLEEAVELAQSLGCTEEEARRVVNYVFTRPKGDPAQEVGGTLVTLAVMCEALGLNMESCAENEYRRILSKTEEIRARNKSKPDFNNA